MNSTLQIMMLIAVFAYFIILIRLLMRKSLILKYTLLWLLSGVVMLVVTIFPQLLGIFSDFVGIYSPTNALFAVLIFFLMVILVSLTAIVSKQGEKIKRLTQTIALIEKKQRDASEIIKIN